MTVERLRWSVLDTDIMWAKEEDSREIPVNYRLLGNQQYLQRVVTKLKVSVTLRNVAQSN